VAAITESQTATMPTTTGRILYDSASEIYFHARAVYKKGVTSIFTMTWAIADRLR